MPATTKTPTQKYRECSEPGKPGSIYAPDAVDVLWRGCELLFTALIAGLVGAAFATLVAVIFRVQAELLIVGGTLFIREIILDLWGKDSIRSIVFGRD